MAGDTTWKDRVGAGGCGTRRRLHRGGLRNPANSQSLDPDPSPLLNCLSQLPAVQTSLVSCHRHEWKDHLSGCFIPSRCWEAERSHPHCASPEVPIHRLVSTNKLVFVPRHYVWGCLSGSNRGLRSWPLCDFLPKTEFLFGPYYFAVLNILSRDHGIFVPGNVSDSGKTHVLFLGRFGEGRASLFFNNWVLVNVEA